eukprot:CAMPEP_0115006672 /NCGR_PEP_ID=MMETSP0216-20121206/20651_1 /TAXON_ID=223996 /ORGANISM="Protocruzia adherens, Strain Boccale" /LENGTH=172 /DNA_ID=CAMNT_0002373323 /DNA_START=121 /DNA_END=635 /DNA_ORIENTATION=+
MNPDDPRRLELFERIVLAEERFSSGNAPALDLEQTWFGRHSEFLMRSLDGDFAVTPFKPLSYRIIRRWADILEMRPEEPLAEDWKNSRDEGIFQALEEEYHHLQDHRVEREWDMWEEEINETLLTTGPTLGRKIKASLTLHHIRQHEMFSKQNGIDRLCLFLIGKTLPENRA